MGPKRTSTRTSTSAATGASGNGSGALPKKRPSKLAKENNITADQEAEIREAFDLFSVPDPDHEQGPSHSRSRPGAVSSSAAGTAAGAASAVPQVIKTANIRRCLVALDAYPPSTPASEITSVLDSENIGYVSFDSFFAYAALKVNEAAHQGHDADGSDGPEEAGDRHAEESAREEQIREAFGLFTRDDGSRGPGDKIGREQGTGKGTGTGTADGGGVIRLQHLRRVVAELREDIPDSTLRDMISEANGGAQADFVTLSQFEDVMRRAGVFG